MTLLSCRANSRLPDPINIEWKAFAPSHTPSSRQNTHTTEVDFIQCDQGLSGFKLRTSTQPNPSRHSAKCQTVTTIVNMTTRPRGDFRPRTPNSLEQATPPPPPPNYRHAVKICNVQFWHFSCALRRQERRKVVFGRFVLVWWVD